MRPKYLLAGLMLLMSVLFASDVNAQSFSFGPYTAYGFDFDQQAATDEVMDEIDSKATEISMMFPGAEVTYAIGSWDWDSPILTVEYHIFVWIEL